MDERCAVKDCTAPVWRAENLFCDAHLQEWRVAFARAYRQHYPNKRDLFQFWKKIRPERVAEVCREPEIED